MKSEINTFCTSTSTCEELCAECKIHQGWFSRRLWSNHTDNDNLIFLWWINHFFNELPFEFKILSINQFLAVSIFLQPIYTFWNLLPLELILKILNIQFLFQSKKSSISKSARERLIFCICHLLFYLIHFWIHAILLSFLHNFLVIFCWFIHFKSLLIYLFAKWE